MRKNWILNTPTKSINIKANGCCQAATVAIKLFSNDDREQRNMVKGTNKQHIAIDFKNMWKKIYCSPGGYNYLLTPSARHYEKYTQGKVKDSIINTATPTDVMV